MEPEMSHQEIRIEIDNGVAVLSLHRPDRMNAFTVTMAHELAPRRQRRRPRDYLYRQWQSLLCRR